MTLLKRLCTLLQAAASEYDGAGSTESPEPQPAAVQGFCISTPLLSDLQELFHSIDRDCLEIADLWEELAKKSIPAGSVVKILTETMESGGLRGMKAADIYLSLLLVPRWPVYSLFSPTAFDSFARCLRNACKFSTKAMGGQICAAADDKGKRGQKKGKRSREKERQPRGWHDEKDLDQGGHQGSPEEMDIVSMEIISSLCVKLQKIVLVLHFNERQETLKLIVGLLADLLHPVSVMKEDEIENSVTSVTCKRRACLAQPFIAVRDVVFSILRSLLGVMHGEPVKTAIMVLQALAPIILLSHTAGSSKFAIRNTALQFVTHTLLTAEFTLIRPAVVALPRYLCFKAPERSEGRSLAVESVLHVLRASSSQEWCRFADFLRKFSHSKPRHRLFAIDIALALLGGLPNPLKQQALSDDLGSTSPINLEDQILKSHRGDNENSKFLKPDIDRQLVIDEEVVVEVEELDKARENSGPNEEPGVKNSDADSEWWGITCFEILLHRCSDKGAAIRARALTNLAQAINLLSMDVSSRRLVQTLLRLNVVERSSQLPTATPLSPGAGHRDLWSLLQRRCLDEKAAVRKATFLLMKALIGLLGKPPHDAAIHAMGAACGDPMISTRKAALSALSEVVRRFPGDAKVAREWLNSALPLAFDNEQALQDECQSLFEDLVLDRISLISTLNLSKVQCSSGNRKTSVSQDVENLLPVGALNLLKEMDDGSSISSCVARVCTSLGKKKRVRPGVALALQNLISAQLSPAGAWFLLSEVTAYVPKAVSWEFLRSHWKLLDKKDNCSSDNPRQTISVVDKHDGSLATSASSRVHLLQTIFNVAVELPPDSTFELATKLLDRLKAFNMHPAEVGAHIKTLAILCKRIAVASGEDQLVVQWAKDLIGQAENILQAAVTSSFLVSSAVDNVSQIPIPHNGDCSGGKLRRGKRSQHGAQATSRKHDESSPHIVTVIFTVGALALTSPQVKSGQVVTLLQTLLTRALLGQKKGGKTCRVLLKELPEVNVHVRVALGKLSLGDDDLAKRCAPIFAQELGRSNLPAVRNNIMIIMADFCVRHTALANVHIHDMTRTLCDPCELVRRQAFVLLSRLLQRDYVKWRGILFHRFLLALVDDSEKIRRLATYVFGSTLKLKAPMLAYNSFVEAIFVLNDCISQASSSSLLQIPENDRGLFCLRGDTEDVVDKRMKIYATLLQHMVPEHILATSAKLCAEILAVAADGLLCLNNGPSQSVLKDALRILASKELRTGGARASAGNVDLEDDGGAAAALAAVKGRVVTQLMKKNLVENAVPIFIELKRLLESRNSPVLGLLMECMRVMLKDYKDEIEEILVADKQLQKEILYDMQKHEAAFAQAKVAEAAAAIPMEREAMQQVSPGMAQTPAPAGPITATGKQVRKRTTGKNVVDDEAELQARNTTGSRENEDHCPNVSSISRTTRKIRMKVGSDILTQTAFASLKRSAVGNRSGDSRAAPSPCISRQNEQTPEIQTYSAMPSSLSHRTPFGPKLHPRSSHRICTPRMPGEGLSIPVIDCQEDCLAGAVAHVVAASTVATVLQQVAQKSVTPFKAMSIPRLRADFSSMNSAPWQQQSITGVKDNVLKRSGCEVGNALETVRRRQSFSTVDEPCGSFS